MPIQYGQYQLPNSQRVKPFVGSSLPELTSVAGTMQERYDKALETEDDISRAVKLSQAAPFTQDQQLLANLKQEYTNRIRQRATKGDYENMMRDTMIDSRNFMDRYKPIVENNQRYQQYQAQLQDDLSKGVIKSPEKAQKLLALSAQSYSGLQYDPASGQYTNKFQGISAVKDIDPTEKIDKWMKDVAPTVLGKKIKYVDGMWMKEDGGKTTTLTKGEIQQVITAGRRLDPEFNAWLNQEKQLSTVGIRNLSTQDIQKMEDSPVKQAIMASMQQGASPTQAAHEVMSTLKEQDVYHNMQAYANKYIRDDKETESGITGANPYELERHKKKLEDENLVLSMPILQPEARTEINGGTDIMNKIGDATTAVQTARKNFDDWVRTSQLRPNGKGSWVDADGNDKTLKYLEQKQVYEQAQHGLQNLRQLEAEAKRRTGYDVQKNITPQMLKQADQHAEQVLGSYAGEVLQPGEAETIKQQAKTEYLRTHSPGYAQYDQMLKDMTAKGAQSINVQTFNSKSANKQAEDLFKAMVLNLDASGLKSGTQGLTWASGDKAGQSLEADDYGDISADAVFAGYGMDTDGQLKYYYKVGSAKQNAKGNLVGQEKLVKMPALPGTTEVLLKNKQTDLAQLGLGQQINQTINQPSGQGYINIGGDPKNPVKVFVDRIDKTEIGKSEIGSGINLRFPSKAGPYTEIRAASVGDAINLIKQAIEMQAKKDGQK